MTEKEILEYSKRLAAYKKEISNLETAAPDFDEQVKNKFLADSANRAKFIDATVLIGAATKEFRNVFGVDAPHYALSDECYLAVDRNGNGRFYTSLDKNTNKPIFEEDELLTVEDPMSDNEKVTNYMDCWEIANAARFDSNMTCANYFGDDSKSLFVKKQRFFIDSKKDSTSSPAHNPVCPPGFEKWAGGKVYNYICKCFDLDELSLYRLFGGNSVQTIPTEFTIQANGNNKFDCNINEEGVITKNNFEYKYYREDEEGNKTNETDDEPIIAASNEGQALPSGCVGSDNAPIKWYKYRVVDTVTKVGSIYRHELDMANSPFANSDLSLAEFELSSKKKGVFNRGYAILTRNPKQSMPSETSFGPGYFDIEYCVNIIWRENNDEGNLDLGDVEVKTKPRKFLWWSWEKKTTVNKDYTVTFKPINVSGSIMPEEIRQNIARFIFNMEDECLRYYNWLILREIENTIPNITASKEKIEDLRNKAKKCSDNASIANWNSMKAALKNRVLFDILERDPIGSEENTILNFGTASSTRASAQLNGTVRYIKEWQSKVIPGWPKWLRKLFKFVSTPVYTNIKKMTFKLEQTDSSFLNAKTTSYALSRDEYKGPSNGDLTASSLFYTNNLLTASQIVSKFTTSQKIALWRAGVLDSYFRPTKITIGRRTFLLSGTEKFQVVIEKKLTKVPTYDNIKRAQTINGFMDNNVSMYFDAFSTLSDRINKRTGTLRELYSLLESTNINAQMIRQKQNNIGNLSKFLNTYEITGGIGTNVLTIKLAPWEPAAMAYSNLERMGVVYVFADNTTTRKKYDTSKININNQYANAAVASANPIILDKNWIRATITEIIDKISDTQYNYTLTSDAIINQNKVYYTYDENTLKYTVATEAERTDDNIGNLYEQSAYPVQGPIFKVTLSEKVPDTLKNRNPILVKVYNAQKNDVNSSVLRSLEVLGDWSETCIINNPVDISGLMFKANYSNGSFAYVNPDYTPTTWGSTPGEQTVNFSYTEDGVTVTAEKTANVTIYQKVKYLESTGTQLIDTGYGIVTSTDEVELYYQLIDGTVYKWIFGEHDNNARFGLGSGDGTNRRNIAYGSSTTQKADTYFFNNKHTYKASTSGVYIDNDKIVNYSSFSSTSTIYLFNLNLNGGTTYGAKSRIWGYKHKRNGQLIRDLVPCYRVTDNTPGLYDNVSGNFFINQGTGDFIIGL